MPLKINLYLILAI